MDIRKVYQQKLTETNVQFEAVGYQSYGNQKVRHDAVSDLRYMIPPSSVLDIGCGYGDLSARFNWANYTGIDIMKEFIDEARVIWGTHSRARFFVDDFLKDTKYPKADLVVACGTFAWQDGEDVKAMLRKMWQHTERNMVFTTSNMATMSWFEMVLTSLGIRRWICRNDLEINDSVFYCYKRETG